MVIVLIIFGIGFLLTIIEQTCCSIACKHARNANLKISMFDEFASSQQLKTWSTISEFANNEGDEKLKKLVEAHKCLFITRMICFILFILTGMYAVMSSSSV